MFETTQSGDLNQIVNESLGTLNNVDRRIRALRAELATVAPQTGVQPGVYANAPRTPSIPWMGMDPSPVTARPEPFHGAPTTGYPAATPFSGPAATPFFQPTAFQPTIPGPIQTVQTPFFGAPGVNPTPLAAPRPAPEPTQQSMAYGAPSFSGVPTMDPNQATGANVSPLQGGVIGGLGQNLPVTGRTGLQQGVQPGFQRPTEAGPVRQPPVDVFDEGKELVFQFELPGVKKESLELTAMDRGIALRAKSAGERNEEGALMRERGPVEYVRQIPLPTEIVTTKTKAKFEDGVLTVTVPKKNPTEGPQRVSIS